MEPKKSIRDISTSKTNIISDIIPENNEIKTVKRSKVLKTKINTDHIQEERAENKTNEVEEEVKINSTVYKKNNKFKSILRKIIKNILIIKPIYTISFVIIILLLLALVLIPSPKAQDPVKQASVEAEMVKKELSKHMILPTNQQIDIRKITSKVEDPFFQNAEIGDYLIIFYENRIAYIYSIEKNIIVNAGVVFIDPKTATTTTTKNQ